MSSDTTQPLPDFSNCLVGGGRYHLLELLGSGGFAKVYRALDRESNPPREVAVKCMLRYEKGWRKAAQKHEIALHDRASQSPGVLPLHNVIWEESYVYLVVELCSSSLYGFLCSSRAERMPEEWISWILSSIVEGVMDCHRQGVYHRDLKHENILLSLDETPRVFISDFGLASEDNLSREFRCGTNAFMSPECLGESSSRSLYSAALSDVWSLGIILFYLLANRSPWASPSVSDDHFRSFTANPEDFLKHFGITGPFLTVLLRILVPESRRMTLVELWTTLRLMQEPTDGTIENQVQESEYMDGSENTSFPSLLTSQWTSRWCEEPVTPSPQYAEIGASRYMIDRDSAHPDTLPPILDLPLPKRRSRRVKVLSALPDNLRKFMEVNTTHPDTLPPLLDRGNGYHQKTFAHESPSSNLGHWSATHQPDSSLPSLKKLGLVLPLNK